METAEAAKLIFQALAMGFCIALVTSMFFMARGLRWDIRQEEVKLRLTLERLREQHQALMKQYYTANPDGPHAWHFHGEVIGTWPMEGEE